jgi:hypothetical protein
MDEPGADDAVDGDKLTFHLFDIIHTFEIM